MSKNNGGAAFPSSVRNDGPVGIKGFHGEDIDPGTASHYGGMTLRDYFAAKALSGLCAEMSKMCLEDIERLARRAPGLAYALADAMLRERAK